METQPTQNSLMQIFGSLGLATDSPLAGLEGQSADSKAFASLLSGYLPGQAQGVNPDLLSPTSADDAPLGLLNTAPTQEESLPQLGQMLPLET